MALSPKQLADQRADLLRRIDAEDRALAEALESERYDYDALEREQPPVRRS